MPLSSPKTFRKPLTMYYRCSLFLRKEQTVDTTEFFSWWITYSKVIVTLCQSMPLANLKMTARLPPFITFIKTLVVSSLNIALETLASTLWFEK